MPTEPRKDSDQGVEDVLSGFNAEQILEDPDDLDPDDEHDEGEAATPDSPNPI
jgi:hypothetical protein